VKRHPLALAALSLVPLLCSLPARAGTVYSNDFEDSATAFDSLTPSGKLTALSTFTLPTDSGGISSANHSTWLARLGLSVAKVVSTPEIVTLSLSGLTPGAGYVVSFDLFIGGSWDGSAGCCGPDEWALKADSGANHTTLVDATFSNCGYPTGICGLGGPQTYSDATPLAGRSSTTFHPEMGADFFSDSSGNYSLDYGIYYFSHGTGNPTLSFTAGDTTGTLIFERISGNTDSSDEYWGIDNVTVADAANAPEPASAALLAAGILLLAWRRRVRHGSLDSPIK
jgi:hypothetical protein